MVRVENLTVEELRKVYMKMKKNEIVEMLIECNRVLELLKPPKK